MPVALTVCAFRLLLSPQVYYRGILLYCLNDVLCQGWYGVGPALNPFFPLLIPFSTSFSFFRSFQRPLSYGMEARRFFPGPSAPGWASISPSPGSLLPSLGVAAQPLPSSFRLVSPPARSGFHF